MCENMEYGYSFGYKSMNTYSTIINLKIKKKQTRLCLLKSIVTVLVHLNLSSKEKILWNSVNQKFYNNTKTGYFLQLMNYGAKAT